MATNKIEMEYIVKGYTSTNQQMRTILEQKQLLEKEGTTIRLKAEGSKELRSELEKLIDYSIQLKQQLSSVGEGSKQFDRIKESLKETASVINRVKNALTSYGSEADRVYVKVAESQQKAMGAELTEKRVQANKQALKKQQEAEIKSAEKVLDTWQDAYRKLYKSQNELLNGKKLTPSEIKYLQEVLASSEKEMNKLLGGVESLSGKFKGAAANAKELRNHIENARAFTERNAKETTARDYLTQSETRYDNLLEKRREIVKSYGEENEAVKKVDAELNEITSEREKQKQILRDIIAELSEEDVAEKATLQDVLNRVAQREKEGQQRREEKAALQEIKQNEQDYLKLIQQEFQIQQKIANLSKDKKSEKANSNQIAVLKQSEDIVRKQIDDLGKQITFEGDFGKKVASVKQQLAQQRAETAAHNKDLEKQNNIWSTTLGNFMKFTIYYQSLNILRNGVNQLLDTMKDLDKAFNDIQIVTEDSAEGTRALAQEYNALAKSMGSTTTEVAEGASEWLRQGYTTAEVTDLLTASMTLSKVGAMDSADATQYLTSSLNGYKWAVEDAMTVVDKISAVDIAAATSSEELASALSRTANMADQSGVSFDKLLGMIGTVSSVTRRSAETIGEAYKTIFSRMSNVAAGKDTDDDGEALNNVEIVLKKNGIALRDSLKDWRSFEDVLDEVAAKWNDFAETERSQIATAIAGKKIKIGRVPEYMETYSAMQYKYCA